MATNKSQAGSEFISGSMSKSNATFSAHPFSSYSGFLARMGYWVLQWASPMKWVWEASPQGTLPHAGKDYEGDYNGTPYGWTVYGSVQVPSSDTVDVVQGFSDSYGPIGSAYAAPYSWPRTYHYAKDINYASPWRITDRMYLQFEAAIATQESATSTGGVQVGYQFKQEALDGNESGPKFTWSFRRNRNFKAYSIDFPRNDDPSSGLPADFFWNSNPDGPFPHQGNAEIFEDRGVEFRYKDDGTTQTKEIRFQVYNSVGFRQGHTSDWYDVSDGECFWELEWEINDERRESVLKETFKVGNVEVFSEYWDFTLSDYFSGVGGFWTGFGGRHSTPSWALSDNIYTSLLRQEQGVYFNRNSSETENRSIVAYDNDAVILNKRGRIPIPSQSLTNRTGWEGLTTWGNDFADRIGLGEWSFETFTASTGKCTDWDYGQNCDRGAASFSLSNIEFGFGGWNEAHASNQYLGPKARTDDGYDWEIPSGPVSAYQTTYDYPDENECFSILPWASNIAPKTQSLNRSNERVITNISSLSSLENYKFEEGWAGAWDFGIESGSLPEGVRVMWGSAVKRDNVVSGQTGTVQFYAIGREGLKILSPTYSWNTGARLQAYYPTESSSTPLNKVTWNAECVWIVGDPSFRSLPIVSGGTAPYTFTLLDDGYRDSRYLDVPVANRLPFDTSDGGFGPLPNNSLSTHFLSSRGANRVKVRVTDSVGNYVDIRTTQQVIWPSAGIAEHYHWQYPTVTKDFRTDELTDWYSADPNYDFTFFEDRYAWFSWGAYDRVSSRQSHSGSLSIVSGSLPTDFLQGIGYSGFMGYDYAHQKCIHKETSETTGTCVIQLQMPEGDIIQSQEFSWVCKVNGDYMTFGYEDPFVHPNASADSNYDHVWADGAYKLEVLETSLPDRTLFAQRFRLSAGTLPEGVTLDTTDGSLTMDGSVNGGADTGSYTIEFTCYDWGYREHTYTWKREGIGV